jgi:hypothetical protein
MSFAEDFARRCDVVGADADAADVSGRLARTLAADASAVPRVVTTGRNLHDAHKATSDGR